MCLTCVRAALPHGPHGGPDCAAAGGRSAGAGAAAAASGPGARCAAAAAGAAADACRARSGRSAAHQLWLEGLGPKGFWESESPISCRCQASSD